VHQGVRFGRFEWRPAQRQLLADGRPVALGGRAFDLMSALIENRARVMSKTELIDIAWPHMAVEDNNLTVQMSGLRKVLGDQAIATVPGRGYQWAMPMLDHAADAGTGRSKPSIAVLPFANASGQVEQEYFVDGLVEDIVTSLSRSPWVHVVASSSSLQFRDPAQPLAEICRQLGVQYLVRGSVRRVDRRLRISAELLAGSSGDVVWGERYDRPDIDLFELQNEIAAKIVGTIEPAYLKQEERRAVTADDRDLPHWDLVMRARWHYWRSSKKHSAEARRLLEHALRLRPDDVATLSLLAFSLCTEVWSGWTADPKGTSIEARRVAMRAVALNDMDAFAHFALGVTSLGFGDIDEAIANQRRALALYPHFAAAAAEVGRLLAFSRQTDEARRLTLQAMADSPTDPRMALWVFALGIASFVDSDPTQAIHHAQAAIALRRDWYMNHLLLAASLVQMGELPKAREAMAEGLRLLPSLSLSALRFGHPFRFEEDRERYVNALRQAGWSG
jgi:TolB-like protein/Flp pilus assembly protein TadD